MELLNSWAYGGARLAI